MIRFSRPSTARRAENIVKDERLANGTLRSTVVRLPQSLFLRLCGALLFCTFLALQDWRVTTTEPVSDSLPPNRRSSNFTTNEPPSKTTEARQRAEPKSQPNEVGGVAGISVDILSIGSNVRSEYWQTQRDTFGRHLSVRNFWPVTEDDDYDRACHEELQWSDVQKIADYCRGNEDHNRFSWLLASLTTFYSTIRQLKARTNPVGWLCAQQRPMVGLYEKALMKYKHGLSIPDYLFIIDDDTFLNFDMFERFAAGSNSSHASALTPCMIRYPKSLIEYTFPYGGYGYILSRGAIQNLIRPISCLSSGTMCRQVQQNLVGEAKFFREEMSLADLFYQYTVQQTYRKRKDWEVGFCFHSDWVWGYFNLYNITEHHLEMYLDSRTYVNRFTGPGKRTCTMSFSNCHTFTSACHYIDPPKMRILHNALRSRYPDRYLKSKESSDLVKPFIFDVVATSTLAHRLVYSSHSQVRHFRTNPDQCASATYNYTERAARCSSHIDKYPWLGKSWKEISSNDSERCRERTFQTFVGAVRSYKGGGYPDFLLIAFDKGTYFNLDALQDYLHLHMNDFPSSGEPFRSSFAIAGCMELFNHSPFVSFHRDLGLVISGAMIRSLLEPIHCNISSQSETCRLINEDRFGERILFREGMTLVDLLEKQTRTSTSASSLYVGECVDSTWLISAYLNYFMVYEKTDLLATQDNHPLDELVIPSFANATFHPMASSVTFERKSRRVKQRVKQTVLCDTKQCGPETLVCANLSKKDMLKYHRRELTVDMWKSIR